MSTDFAFCAAALARAEGTRTMRELSDCNRKRTLTVGYQKISV